nr:TetR/AcrR family transcriptional regulator [Mycolicibacterium malmesburyense]CRL68309.1 TetR family transcriptional regulator [Mycolicibacterium malmesburyense]
MRKSEIVAAALELFTENGYEKTTVAAIIGELGVAKGCFYHHFRSKEEVFEACVLLASQQIAETFATGLQDRSRSPAVRLMDFHDSYRELTDAASSVLLADLYSRAFSDMHHRVTAQVAAEVLPAVTALIDEGVQAGEFDVADSHFTAVAILGALQGLHEAYAAVEDLDQVAHRRKLIEMFERILSAEFP